MLHYNSEWKKFLVLTPCKHLSIFAYLHRLQLSFIWLNFLKGRFQGRFWSKIAISWESEKWPKCGQTKYTKCGILEIGSIFISPQRWFWNILNRKFRKKTKMSYLAPSIKWVWLNSKYKAGARYVIFVLFWIVSFETLKDSCPGNLTFGVTHISCSIS